MPLIPVSRVRIVNVVLGVLALGLLIVGRMTPQSDAQDPGADRRLLFSFEEPADLARLSRRLDQAELIVVQDNGVTDGQKCARLTVRKGSEYGGFELDAAAMKNWGNFDYLAIDVFQEDSAEYRVVVELWDGQTRNYATRCTWEDVTTHAGHQTLLYPIKRARRNGKEGREWDELEPKDKMNLNGLTRVRVFLSPKSDRDAIFWIDQIRLLQEDAAKPKLTIPLPAQATAFKFGSTGSAAPGFQLVTPELKPTTATPFGFHDASERTSGGEGWPDAIGGTFVMAQDGQELDFRALVANGRYHYWMIAGPIYRTEPQSLAFKLSLNEEVLMDARPTPEQYHSETHFYRFLHTPYSNQPQALWSNYLSRMYPVHQGQVDVKDGTIRLRAINHFVSALVLVPNESEREFLEFVVTADRLRSAAFAKTLPPTKHLDPLPPHGHHQLFLPERSRTMGPDVQPTAEELSQQVISAAGTPGEQVLLRVAVATERELNPYELTFSDLRDSSTPPQVLPVKNARIYLQNFRSDGRRVDEMALLPNAGRGVMTAGSTHCCWIRWQIPAECRPGIYRGQMTFRSSLAPADQQTLRDVEIEVYPFSLEHDLPVSYGLYYSPRTVAGLSAEKQRAVRLQQLRFMREIGLTSVSVGGPTVQGLGPQHAVKLKFDTEMFELAKRAGLGRRPEQHLMATALGMGRAIGRRLPGSEGPLVDRNPGIELKQPEFADYFLNGAQQYREFLEREGLPVAVEIVDEPRETPNPWNRNLADTLTYAELLHRTGLTTFVTPVSDKNDGKDYTILADHADIVSVHAWPASKGLIRKTKQNSKSLWFYNMGMDRFSWGFYPWAAGATGRWEWHYCWNEDRAQGGYPGRDGFNPFTGTHGFVPDGPIDDENRPVLFQSKLLDVADGITDRAYLYALESRLAAAKENDVERHRHAIATGEALLEKIRSSIPEFPEVKGLADASAGALVGQGVQDQYQAQSAEWRREIAEALKRFGSDK